MPPITDIVFDESDASRIGRTSLTNPAQVGDGGPIVPISIGVAGAQGVALISVGSVPATGYVLMIAADTQDYNVYNEFVLAYGVPPADVILEVVVNPGVIVSASSTAAAALTWGNAWTGAPTFTLTNEGYIVGKGGAGGRGASQSPTVCFPAHPGSAGGKALELSGETVSIDNGTGFIWGGGGGGGGSAVMLNGILAGSGYANGGGGGGGAGNGTGGAAQTGEPDTAPWSIIANAQNGNTPLVIAGAGSGGTGADSFNGVQHILGGAGGNGGDYGSAGTAGSIGGGDAAAGPILVGLGDAGGDTCGINPTPGGAAGKAINLTGGTANFTSGSGAPNVKGAVS